MRQLVAGTAVVLLLEGCGSPADPSESGSQPPSAVGTAAVGSTSQAWRANLGTVCDALNTTVKLPGEGTIRYTARFNKPTGWATNLPTCGIEPEGEYYDVAAKVPTFGRAKFDYVVLTEAERPRVRFPRYTPETAQELLTLDQADPLGDAVPCASAPCKNGIHGYQYNFRFQTVKDDIAVSAKFDYITTDVGGDKKPQYRAQAIEAFIASMDAIISNIK